MWTSLALLSAFSIRDRLFLIATQPLIPQPLIPKPLIPKPLSPEPGCEIAFGWSS